MIKFLLIFELISKILTDSVYYPIKDGTKIKCPNSEVVVISGSNFDPKEYLINNLPPIIKCSPPFLKSSFLIDNILISNPSFSCIPQKLNSCPCPSIGYIDQEEIRNLSPYLGSLPTAVPDVLVDEYCRITVDPSGVSKFKNFFLTIFRSNGPPIFSKRIFPANSEEIFTPIGLECQQIGDNYEWIYYGGIIKNMKFSFQSNDGMCQCSPFPKSNLIFDGICDIFELKCPEPTNDLYLSDQEIGWNLLLPNLSNETIFDSICVDGNWYYNGIKLSEDAEILCNDPVSILDLTPTTYNYTYGCRDLIQITNENEFMMVYDLTGDFSDFEISFGTVEYSNDSIAKIKCADFHNIVFFSRNFEPIMYSKDQFPHVTCQKSPLSLPNTHSGNYWFVDGIMLSEAAFACLSR